jgi:PAS domain S-box-containing protein
MAMPWVESLSDPQELRRCIRDLAALSALSAIWSGYGPQQIGDGVAAALVSMLNADFVYIALPGVSDGPQIEVIHAGKGIAVNALDTFRAALRRALSRISEQEVVIANPAGDGDLRLATAPIGLGDEAVLIAGSGRQPDFPNEVQRLLLSIAANDTSVALQRWEIEVDKERFGSLIECSSDFVGFVSLHGRLEYLNPAGLALVGLSHLNGEDHILDFVATEDRGRAHDESWPLVISTGRWIGELNFRHFKSGDIIPMLVDWCRVDNPRTPQPMSIATIGRDLTAHKKVETDLHNLNESLEHRVARRTAQLATANEKLMIEINERQLADAHSQQLQHELSHAGRLSMAGQMAAALAHEVNQPLTAILNSVNAVRRLLVDGGQERIGTVREIMEETAEQAVRVGHIVRRLRDFVRRSETEKKMENVTELIVDASSFAQTGTGTLGIQVNFDFDPNISTVFVNRIQVQQVLVNLIRNAIEAMAHTERRVLGLTTRGLGGDMIEIAVMDNGPGISPEVARQLFEPFVSTKRDGMGLGLSICRSIIEGHGGGLRSEPNPAGGTIFRFTLPHPGR